MFFQIDLLDILFGITIGIFILIVVLVIVVHFFVLFSAIKVMKGGNDSFAQICLTFLILAILSYGPYFIPLYQFELSCIAFIADIFIVKARHDLSFGKAFLVILIYSIVIIIIVIIMVIISVGSIG